MNLELEAYRDQLADESVRYLGVDITQLVDDEFIEAGMLSGQTPYDYVLDINRHHNLYCSPCDTGSYFQEVGRRIPSCYVSRADNRDDHRERRPRSVRLLHIKRAHQRVVARTQGGRTPPEAAPGTVGLAAAP